MNEANAGCELPPETLNLVARRFKVLGEPTRLRLLQTLRSSERTVTELVAVAGTTQANVSKHLALLAEAGLVDRRRNGAHVHYFISEPMIFDLCDLVCSSLRRHHEEAADRLPAATR